MQIQTGIGSLIIDSDRLEFKRTRDRRPDITTSETSGCDGIPVELFQIQKNDAMKVQHSICQQIWETQQWTQDWKRSVFIPIPEKGKAKNAQTTAQFYSSNTLAK